MKIAIIGSREYTSYFQFCALVNKAIRVLKFQNNIEIECIISGGARGVDTMAAQYAHENNIKMVEHKPDWDRDGKAAPFVRNKKIVNDADVVIAVWDMKSRGTKDAIKHALRTGKRVTVADYKAFKIIEDYRR